MKYNKILLGGHLTRDPQIKYLPNQTAITEFGIAVNRQWKTESGEEREEVSFLDCTAFGKTGEAIAKFFTKGRPIFVDGRIKQETWTDKQTSQKRSKLVVIVDTFSFCGGNAPGESGDPPARRIAGDALGIDLRSSEIPF